MEAQKISRVVNVDNLYGLENGWEWDDPLLTPKSRAQHASQIKRIRRRFNMTGGEKSKKKIKTKKNWRLKT